MKCKGRNRHGKSCQANALTDSEYCFFHDPKKKAARAAAQKAGGVERSRCLANAVLCTAKTVRLDSTESVIDLLSATINQARTGKIGLKVANTVGYLSQILLKALDQGELEKRLEEIEKALESR